jgi:hypothetical protein
MSDVELSPDEVRGIIFSPRHRRRKVWTASSLLLLRYKAHANWLKGEAVDRLKPIRRRAARCLHALWRERAIYRHETDEEVGGWKEARYIRPSDARGSYFVACEKCGRARRSVNFPRGRVLEQCPGCGLTGDQVPESGPVASLIRLDERKA